MCPHPRDGSARFLSQNISLREFAKLVTRDGGEAIATP
jgi:hypothetical protein